MNRKTLFLTVAGVLLLGFLLATALYKDHRSLQQAANLQANPALHREGAPTKGPQEAKVTIVEFFDPACGTCREFQPFVARLLEQYPGKVKVVMRLAPLHPGSEVVVRMLEAAHRQGQFWQALERLFSTQEQWVIDHVSQPMRARAILENLKLDQTRLSTEMNSPEVIQVVQQEIRDGQSLNVRATPEFFVNGRPMPSFGYEPLQQLVKEAVTAAY